jgi:glycerate kinase
LVAHLDLDALRRRLAGVTVVVACDVHNPLVGLRGAAAVYGPQKGADERQVAVLDAALGHWADVVTAATGADRRDAPGAGAAGGVGYAALALLGGELRPGIELLLDLVGFDDALGQLTPDDLVVTGEGSLDEQTLHGKAPAGVAAAAAARGIPVVAVCGRTTLDAQTLRGAGIDAAYALTDIEADPQRCFDDAAPLLRRLGAIVATTHLAGPGSFDSTTASP